MKKILSMVLSVAMMLSMASVAYAAPAGTISATVDGPVAKGETVEVDINFDSNPGMWMGQVRVAYDSELEFVSVTDTGLFGDEVSFKGSNNVKDPANPFVQMVWEYDQDDAMVYNRGTAATLTFKVPDEATNKDTYSISFKQINIADSNGGKVNFTGTGCDITISGANTYPIRTYVGANGSISPAGDTGVEAGQSITYTITADEGYHVESITVDTIPADFVKSGVVEFTLENVTEPHEIKVTFAPHVADSENPDCTVAIGCTGCEDILRQANDDHKWNVGTVTAPATCTTEGNMHYVCTVPNCPGEKDEPIAATGHSHTTVVTPPTCTEGGYTTYTCHCGDTYVADEVPATGHSYTAVITPPTCTAQGYTTYTCAAGDHQYVDDWTPVAAHTWDLGVVTTPATCTEKGVMTYTCTVCGDTKTEDIAATGHNHVAVVTPATCTEGGYTTYTCACGDTYVADRTPATGHAWDDGVVTTPATCTEKGVKTYTCAACGETKTEDIAATGHNHVAVVTPATCTEGGYTTYTCACGDTYVADQTPAAGHDLQEKVITPATCQAEGEKCMACTKCDYTENHQVLPKIDHIYVDDYCTMCEKREPGSGGGGGGSSSGGSSGGASVVEYTLTFDTNGGTAVGAVTTTKNANIKLKDYKTTKPGYTFAGWYLDKALTEAAGTSVRVKDDMTLYAKWTINSLTDATYLPFTDIGNHWAKDAIAYAYNTGIMQGVSATSFGPEIPLNRAMVVTILYSMEGKPTVTAKNIFTDVADGTYYAEAVTWAASKGVVAGVGEGKFAPTDLITREQLATIMYRYAEYKGQDVTARANLSRFTDEQTISNWAVEYVEWAVARGIISGMDTGALAPQGTTTRAQCAQIMYSFQTK